uniref:Uncharacterized protein n=1 Tax=Tetranychus urticae TaxID=32264 RepID=T1JYF1_TETUR
MPISQLSAEQMDFLRKFTEKLVIATDNDYLFIDTPRPSTSGNNRGAYRKATFPALQRDQNANLSQAERDEWRKKTAEGRAKLKIKREEQDAYGQNNWVVEGRTLADGLNLRQPSPFRSDRSPPSLSDDCVVALKNSTIILQDKRKTQKCKVVKTTYLIPFSPGKRNCPGEGLANVEIFLYLVCMVQRYRIKVGP